MGGCEPYSRGLGQGPVTGSCEKGNEISGYVKAENYLTSLSIIRLSGTLFHLVSPVQCFHFVVVSTHTTYSVKYPKQKCETCVRNIGLCQPYCILQFLSTKTKWPFNCSA